VDGDVQWLEGDEFVALVATREPLHEAGEKTSQSLAGQSGGTDRGQWIVFDSADEARYGAPTGALGVPTQSIKFRIVIRYRVSRRTATTPKACGWRR